MLFGIHCLDDGLGSLDTRLTLFLHEVCKVEVPSHKDVLADAIDTVGRIYSIMTSQGFDFFTRSFCLVL
jgi:hypothetical protein